MLAGHSAPTCAGRLAVHVVLANSASASQEYHSVDQLRSGKREILMRGRSPIMTGGTGLLGPVSGVVMRGRFTLSAKNQPALLLLALPAPPALPALPSFPSFPSKLEGLVHLLDNGLGDAGDLVRHSCLL